MRVLNPRGWGSIHFPSGLWFFISVLTVDLFRWTLSDNKFLQVFRILLSILDVFNSAVVWMVSILLLVSRYHSFIGQTFRDRFKGPNYYRFHRLFKKIFFIAFLDLYNLSLSFLLTLWATITAKSIRWQIIFIKLSLVFWLVMGGPFVYQRLR